jgi:rhodanese-related sulfurtransferase
MNRTIKPDELKPLVERGDVLLLDVRRQADYDSSNVKLPTAQWRNPEQLAEWSAALPKDRDVVLYCVRGGAVSNAVVDHLHAHGIKARFIEGGIEAWKQAGGATAAK